MGKVTPTQFVVDGKSGELVVTINLNLTIRLDGEGNLSLTATSADARPHVSAQPMPRKEEKVQFEMPDLEDNIGELLPDFGK